MKLATRIWSTSVVFVGLGFAVMLALFMNIKGPPPDFENWAEGALTVIDSKGVSHHITAQQAPHGPPLDVPIVIASMVLSMLLLGALAASRSVVRPLLALQGVARKIGAGDLNARARIASADEVGDVARAFDDMADRVESLVRAQRELLANVSHELRTPLSRVRVALELAGSGAPDATLMRGIDADLKEVEQLIEDLLTASRLDPAMHGPQHLAPTLAFEKILSTDVAGIAADRFKRTWPTHALELNIAPVVLTADLRLVVRLLDNILDNAGKYSPKNSRVSVVAREDGEHVVFVVEDQGVGIAKDDTALLGTPFFRVERSRTRSGDDASGSHGVGGVGLGLVLARRIAEAHGGGIEFDSDVGRGARVIIKLSTRPATAPT